MRLTVVFILQTVLSVAMLLQTVRATDGDVDYSAPYITVDPETGQLVTRNPGPRPKTHMQSMPNPTAADTTDVMGMTDTAIPDAGATGEQSAVDEQQPVSMASMITIVIAGLLVFGTLAFRRLRHKQQ